MVKAHWTKTYGTVEAAVVPSCGMINHFDLESVGGDDEAAMAGAVDAASAAKNWCISFAPDSWIGQSGIALCGQKPDAVVVGPAS